MICRIKLGIVLVMNISEIESRLVAIEARNKRVEVDKAWETSYFRRALLVVFTYLSIGLYMWVIGVERAWLNAVIPSLGFLLSTLTLSYFKDWWLQDRKIGKEKFRKRLI